VRDIPGFIPEVRDIPGLTTEGRGRHTRVNNREKRHTLVYMPGIPWWYPHPVYMPPTLPPWVYTVTTRTLATCRTAAAVQRVEALGSAREKGLGREPLLLLKS